MFVNFLLQQVQVDRPHPIAFRTEGVQLAGDEDTPLRSRIAPRDLPAVSEMSKISLVHLRALLTEFNSNDQTGDGLELEEFVRVMSQVLPGMTQEALEAQFMKVDSNSDGSVQWDEFSSYILAAGAAADAYSEKSEGGALLDGPEPDLNSEVMHSSPMTHVCCHEGAERYVSLALEDKGSVTRQAMTQMRMWSARADSCGEPLLPTKNLCGASAHVMSMCVFEKGVEARGSVLAVASIDSRIRFFDLDKITLLGEIDLLSRGPGLPLPRHFDGA